MNLRRFALALFLAAGGDAQAAAEALAAIGTHDLAGLLPQLQGWGAKSAPRRYGPDNLFDYINGAADGFVDCDFVELVSQVLEGPGGRSLTIDLFRHADPDCAFGIYSQERPACGPFLAVGAQGYHEPGILNFFKGDVYVKLAGFNLGADDRALLERAAAQVAARIPGAARLPRRLDALPAEGRVAHSERFLRRNVLGYPFLERAFAADYQSGSARFTLFILAPGPADAGPRMLAQLLKTAGRSEPVPAGATIAHQDPHHGPMLLRAAGGSLLLLQGAPGPAAERVLAEAQRRLQGL